MELSPPEIDDKKRKFEDLVDGAQLVLTRDELKKLLDPLSKEQLVDLLATAGSKNESVCEEIKQVASKDPAHRKLFVRGLSWETTSQALRDAFIEYGEIEEGAVIMDKTTGKSRGFGFITFKSMDAAYKALKDPNKRIDGRMTVCNLAAAGSTVLSTPADQSLRKLYVGGLSYETTTEALLGLFSQYGEIEEGSVAYDKVSNKSRGFAFVTYKTVEFAKKALVEPNKTLDGRQIFAKLAEEGRREKVSLLASSPGAAYSQQQAAQAQAQAQGYGGLVPQAAAAPAPGTTFRPPVPPGAPAVVVGQYGAPLAYGGQAAQQQQQQQQQQ
eukprot:TRINITY_DN1786_c0_g1_i2.p1 TRINITY_DN1786_c0_g1~~TRINITY_DN1786_c0_g1_i2.p1  ORF type:complete len:327 (-),score=98.56 TRINITY_DN1786_c0_g1_i2:27-1007(-)